MVKSPQMNVFTETSRHLDTLKSDQWAQDQSIILDTALKNNKKKESGKLHCLGKR